MKTLSILNLQMWSNYFAGVTAFQYHPANAGKTRLSIEECAKVADQMMDETHKRFRGDISWAGWPLPRSVDRSSIHGHRDTPPTKPTE